MSPNAKAPPSREELRKELGRRLKAWRTYRGLSLPEVSAITGLSTSSLSRWERGERPIDVEHVLVLVDLYEVDIAELLAFGEPDWPTRASANGERQHQAA